MTKKGDSGVAGVPTGQIWFERRELRRCFRRTGLPKDGLTTSRFCVIGEAKGLANIAEAGVVGDLKTLPVSTFGSAAPVARSRSQRPALRLAGTGQV